MDFGTRATVALLGLGMLQACGGEYEVRIQIEPSSLTDAAELVEVAIVPSCDGQPASGQILGEPIIRFAPGTAPPPLGMSESGARGLFVRLVDSTCGVVAAGCAPVNLEAGGSGVLRVVARAASGAACGLGEACDVGRCVPPLADAGPADGLAEVGDAFEPIDAPVPVDAFVDAPVDTQRDTGCGVCETTNPCEEAVCVGDACMVQPLSDTAVCPGGQCYGGVCCTGCWDGSACSDGLTTSSCGTAGGACATCSCPTPTCELGSCSAQPAYRSVAIGAAHACFVLSTGELYCSGSNVDGRLGIGLSAGRELTPQRVGTETDWLMVGAGLKHTCGIRGAGELYCWGSNDDGQAGLGGLTSASSPIRVGTERYVHLDIPERRSRTLAQRMDGTWVGFGRNEETQLNVEATPSSVTLPSPIRPPPVGSWRVVRLGEGHGCGLAEDGSLHCWGRNDLSQTGLPASVSEAPHFVDAGPFADLFCGFSFTCVLDAAGVLSCLGTNYWRVLGRSTPMETGNTTLAPTDATPEPTVRVIRGYLSLCAASASDTVLCWGMNDDGELGFGDAVFRSSLTLAPHFDDPEHVVFSHNSGYAHMGGMNRVWGANNADAPTIGQGRLGLGHTDDVLVPSTVCIE